MKKLLLSKPMLHLYLFLLLTAVIIGAWKVLRIDDLTFTYMGLVFDSLMKVEFSISVSLVKVFSNSITTVDYVQEVISFSNKESIQLMFGCSGLKQIMQWTLIMLLFPGPWKHKAWFIPASALILVMAAIFHFTLLALILASTPSSFTLFHDDFSRWIFFGIFFLLWVFWEEKILLPKKLMKKEGS